MLKNSKLNYYYVRKVIQYFCIDELAGKTAILSDETVTQLIGGMGCSGKLSIDDYSKVLKDKRDIEGDGSVW